MLAQVLFISTLCFLSCIMCASGHSHNEPTLENHSHGEPTLESHSHGEPTLENHSHGEPTLLTSKSHVEERHHIEHHMNGVIGKDVNQMTDDELQFLYFKMHDSDDNDKLDGCELVKSLLHFHVEEHSNMVSDFTAEGTTRIFGHEELTVMIDPILSSDDKNWDGFIDYVEFSTAQKSRGF